MPSSALAAWARRLCEQGYLLAAGLRFPSTPRSRSSAALLATPRTTTLGLVSRVDAGCAPSRLRHGREYMALPAPRPRETATTAPRRLVLSAPPRRPTAPNGPFAMPERQARPCEIRVTRPPGRLIRRRVWMRGRVAAPPMSPVLEPPRSTRNSVRTLDGGRSLIPSFRVRLAMPRSFVIRRSPPRLSGPSPARYGGGPT
jgi:hypothetical protein